MYGGAVRTLLSHNATKLAGAAGCNVSIPGLPTEKRSPGRLMAVHSLHHFNIRASHAELLILCDFYCNVIGLTLGPRPPFRSSGFWLYADGVPILHLTVASASEFLPEVPDRRSAADHIAFRCSDLEAMVARLRERGVVHSVDRVPLVDEVQIFCRDPSGVGVELNFPGSAARA